MIRKYIEATWLELNHFLSSTSIHGLPYLHLTQSRTTRIIWTVLVVAALTTATVLLVQTVGDWGYNHISTTIETETVEHFPFPAVTFHPGDFSSKKAFLRTFLNHFHLTRYEESNPLYDNDEFMKEFKYFLKNFKGKSLFLWVRDYLLLKEREFIEKKKPLFKDDICSLVALISLGFTNINKLEEGEVLIGLFDLNMFKVREYPKMINFMREEISPKIRAMVALENITETTVNSLCEATENKPTKTEVEALILSYLYTFIDYRNTEGGKLLILAIVFLRRFH